MNTFFKYLIFIVTLQSCMNHTHEYSDYEEYPAPVESNLWLDYQPEATEFKIWSPTAQQLHLHLYQTGHLDETPETHPLIKQKNGIWTLRLSGDHRERYYTFQVQIEGKWLEETPGIYARSVGLNGKRAMVQDLQTTNPYGWEKDQSIHLESPNDAIIYELHIRDMTTHPTSGIRFRGKYLGLAEAETRGPENIKTGLAHLKELGITHLHILPTCDFNSIDESTLDLNHFNWGYDPVNYNVPEGSYATDPYHAEVRIREFKEMIKAIHEEGMGVILDMVYNHTGTTDNSNFNLEVPGYYYRQRADGTLSDASACGNETASDRPMMRKFMLESLLFWVKEYHIDGFRFDLMGIHDIETMNLIADGLRKVNPDILLYGEGWTAGDSPLSIEKRAVKANIKQMPKIAAFSDEIRDGLKGSVFDDKDLGFVSGKTDAYESVKMGIVGCIQHNQVDYSLVNNSKFAWTSAPWQSIAYVSCHDNLTLYDKLKISRADASEDQLIAMDKLGNAVVLTSQGIPFLHAGVEMLRSKNGNHNSYNAPDSVNQINWNWKIKYAGVVNYYKNLIRLRQAHPAFRMRSGDQVNKYLEFIQSEDGLISFRINDHANGDLWKNIYVIYNANNQETNYQLEGEWRLAVIGDEFDVDRSVNKQIEIPPISMAILYQ